MALQLPDLFQDRRRRRVVQILDTAEPVGRRPFERRLRVQVAEHVHRLIPAAAEYVTLAASSVPAPFLNVAGHVICSKLAETWIAAHARRAAATKVAVL